MGRFFADLFKGVGNGAWDLARILSTWAVLSTSGLAIYKLHAGQPVTLTEYANAMMAVLTGCAVFIAGKDVARAHSSAQGGAA